MGRFPDCSRLRHAGGHTHPALPLQDARTGRAAEGEGRAEDRAGHSQHGSHQREAGDDPGGFPLPLVAAPEEPNFRGFDHGCCG